MGTSSENKQQRGVAHLFITLIKGYKRHISPLLPDACIYFPTCSEYAIEAIKRYGALRGGWFTLMRLIRCNPFHKGGYDPVP